MEWLQVLSLFLANAGLIIWFRAESRADWRHMDSKLDAKMDIIQAEMKDFHARLAAQDADFKAKMYALEERTRTR
jgi:hypothetical protein